MGLFDKLKGELVDIIEWTDSSRDTMVYRFERRGNEIKNGAKLTVRESQMAVLVSEGKFADVFSPGMYTLETKNIPIMSTLNGWMHGFNSPFKAEVYFVNTKNFTDQKWGTKNPMTLDDPRFGMLEVRAFGTFATRVVDPKLFLKEIAGTDGHFTTEEISNQLRSLVVTRFSDAFGESGIPIDKLISSYDEISKLCQEKIDKEFAEYGLKMTKFLVENVSMPEDIKKEIYELSRLNRVDIAKLTQMKAAKAIEVAAANPGGLAGAGVGLGVGMNMAQQMVGAFGQAQVGGVRERPGTESSMPPPLPTASYFVAVNGQQMGPLDLNGLKQMVGQGQLTRDTLVWKQGMAAWSPAGQVAEVSSVFGAVPPPLPK